MIRTFVAKPPDQVKVKPVPAGEYDPAIWGKNYPLQYASYLKNRRTTRRPPATAAARMSRNPCSSRNPDELQGKPVQQGLFRGPRPSLCQCGLLESKRIGPASVGACITCKTAQVEEFSGTWAGAMRRFH